MPHVFVATIRHVPEKFNFYFCLVVVIAEFCAAESALIPRHEVVLVVSSCFRPINRYILKSTPLFINDEEVKMRRLTSEGGFGTKQANL